MHPYIEMIKQQGLRVFVRPGKNPPTYCYYTDGVHIGQACWGSYPDKVYTVNLPCREVGCGFLYAEEITPETIRAAMLAVAAPWAYDGQRQAVKKFRDWEAFTKADRFNSQYVEV